MSREPLTTRQRAVYDFIRNWCDVNGYPPTLREIASNIGVRSTNSVYNHLKILERKGYLTREDMKSRTWRPVDAPASSISDIPVVGSIAAGSPILAHQDIQDTISIDRSLVDGQDVFALNVRGDCGRFLRRPERWGGGSGCAGWGACRIGTPAIPGDRCSPSQPSERSASRGGLRGCGRR